ncbi:UDP-glycosyltransferase 13-like [Durio zibethinus]|uniref:UDP-glycosyltransferase 13-like n=1 Tax=Durio zibethinus TaxID=66656 RepID=A0A6P5Y2T7_DURZI|nr:UDP-glycosyltransferase 13-like [Durio zibethinus]
MSNSDGIHSHHHVALLPSSGMGHLIPFLRLAASLVHCHCQLTLITLDPVVSFAESQLISRFLSAFPQVTEKRFTLLPLDPATADCTDPFALHWETIRRSAHLLSPLISSLSSPLSLIITDIVLMSSVIPITANLCLPNYMLFTSSARMFSLLAYLPSIAVDHGSFQFGNVIEIPGIPPIPRSSLSPLLLNSNTLFAKIFSDNSQTISKVNGVLINTFEELEEQSLHTLTGAKVLEELPPVFAVGPLLPCEFEGQESPAALKWLEEQKEGSVVYVSFGSRTATSKEQIRELGMGLVLSGCKFLWVVKTKIVDKEEEDGLDEILGHDLMQRITSSNSGLVVKEWVNQWEILSHKAVGGFVSHCGWNSVVEAALYGVPLLAWPQRMFGDQRINVEVIEAIGLGLCVKSWKWGEDVVLKGEEIGDKIKDLMSSESLKLEAARISQEAKKAVGVDGSCQDTLKKLLQSWKKSE